MADVENRNAGAPPSPGLSGSSSEKKAAEERNWLPWLIAAAVVVTLVVSLTVLGRRPVAPPSPTQAGLSASDPYASRLLISDVKMSEASNFAGSKVTYLEGRLTNKGDKTLTGITAQVAFRNALGEIAQKETLPLMLIRTREPYVDIEPVSASPVKPGAGADFRLVFDHVAEDWNQQYPEVRVVVVEARY